MAVETYVCGTRSPAARAGPREEISANSQPDRDQILVTNLKRVGEPA